MVWSPGPLCACFLLSGCLENSQNGVHDSFWLLDAELDRWGWRLPHCFRPWEDSTQNTALYIRTADLSLSFPVSKGHTAALSPYFKTFSEGVQEPCLGLLQTQPLSGSQLVSRLPCRLSCCPALQHSGLFGARVAQDMVSPLHYSTLHAFHSLEPCVATTKGWCHSPVLTEPFQYSVPPHTWTPGALLPSVYLVSGL